jgi:ferric-dicitrate binding protein FerR (iron transport regulator)
VSGLSCADVQALLSDALDGGEIDPDREAAAAEHLEGCADCARVARELSSVHRLALEARSVAAKPDTKRRGLRHRRLPGPRPAYRSWNPLPLLIAAGLLVAVAAWYFLGRREAIEDHPRVLITPPVATKGLGTLAFAPGSFRAFSQGEGMKGPATLKWNDGTRMILSDNASIDRVEETEEGKLVILARGTLTSDVVHQPAGKPLRFATPHGEARVVGTTLSLRVDPDAKKGTRLQVDTGKVELRNGAGKSVMVDAGFFAVAASGVELVVKKVEAPGWRNVTADVGGAVWGKGGVTLLAPVPGRDEILAGVGYSWLWSSIDGGLSWKKLGDAGEPIENMPHHLVFDPENPRTFWVSGIYGPGLYRTRDGGLSFKRLGADVKHIDGLAVDFSDPMRRTLLVTKHLDGGGLQKSTDGGETWAQIGDRLPADSSSSSMPFILDAKTYLVDATGTIGKSEGLYRSADAGQTWTRVSKTPPAGPPLLASDGALYWMSKAGMGSGVQKSRDRGLTWTMLPGPVKSTPVEIPGGRLIGVFEQQLYVSSDGGAAWEKLGEPIPIKPLRTFTGMTYEMAAYSEAQRAVYVWRGSEGKVADAIFRWSLPE